MQRTLKIASLGLPHATGSELILIIFGFVVKLLLELGVFVNNFLYDLYQFVCGCAINPELGHRVAHQICESPLVGFLVVLRKMDGWFVHSHGRR